jgi:hypothetical protein
MGAAKPVSPEQLNSLRLRESVRVALRELMRADPHAQIWLRGEQLLITGLRQSPPPAKSRLQALIRPPATAEAMWSGGRRAWRQTGIRAGFSQ